MEAGEGVRVGVQGLAHDLQGPPVSPPTAPVARNPLLQGTSSLEAKENLGIWVAEAASEDKWDFYDRVNSII